MPWNLALQCDSPRQVEGHEMLLQLAIDRPDSLAIVPQVAEFVDILEVGTSMLKRFGLAAISTVRELAPDVPILADTKTVDGGAQEAEMVFNAGAMFLTVLSCAAAATHQVVSDVAEKYGAHVVVDTLTERGVLVKEGHVYPPHFDFVCVHAPTDARLAGDVSPSTYIDSISAMHKLGYRVALAGGIGPINLASAILAAPEIVIVGRAITSAEDPRGTTEWIKSQLPNRGHGWPWEQK
jgi:3-hexulose-6-phosphate synthase